MADFNIGEMQEMQRRLQEKYRGRWEAISPETGKAVKKLDDVIKADAKKGITETIPTFRSLTVVYSPTVISHKKLISYLGTAIEKSEKASGGNEEKTIHIILL